MGKVVGIGTETIPAERVLGAAQEANLDSVIIIGIKRDGNPYYAATHSHVPQMMWEIRLFEQSMMDKYA